MADISQLWYTLHDNGSIKCLIGQGTLSTCIKYALGDVEHVSFEYVKLQTYDWIAQRQFILGTSDVKFKQEIVAWLDQHQAHYFSLIGCSNVISAGTMIGHGTFINLYNDLMSDSIIGDHCVITTHCQLGHGVEIKNFSHISSYCYLNNIVLGQGTVFGLRTTAAGPEHKKIPDYCNFLMNSVITDSYEHAGTYYNKKKISNQNSLLHRIL
jgi:NDP-sugar pyrophosphorylase family protein